ncbi:MAG: sugar phosphate isomerase/epimerase [Candidatus Solibacter usitatus]|nr:sugar phosphate isomerase/epimerase [Candidatus Solibacter usitatus]
MNSTRRRHLATLAAAAGSLQAADANPQSKMTLCAFSKHFQWTDIKETAELCASFGYEGIDITLRPGGHVLPERVEDDLPKAVDLIRKAGLKVPMVTSHIVDAKTPHAERVVKALAGLGIRNYRWGGFRYNDRAPIPAQVEEFRARTKDLAALNRQYGVCAMYHTHSGVTQVGASFWDLYLILKDQNPAEVSVNYDIGHATVEGGLGGWQHSSRLLMPYVRGVALKDFAWKQNDKKGWSAAWCALGQGMVNFKLFLPMLKAANFQGPLQLHMEYPELGGADSGKSTYSIPKAQLLEIFRRDVVLCKKMLREAGLA